MAKRRRGEQSFRFDSFCEPGNPTHFDGSFQENIKTLLMFAHSEALGQGRLNWFQLELRQHPLTTVRLFVVEEDVETSTHRQCRCCLSAGWGHHIICSKRFHFVLPIGNTFSEVQNIGLQVKAKSANTNLFMMHGFMHSNGFGHLLHINGYEGGSHLLSGHQILDLWDRICTALQVRKISLVDTSTKSNMELRLIHGVAYGEPWFGRWGYKFGSGSFGVTQHMYQQSLEALQALPLHLLAPHFACFGQEIPIIVAKYQSLCNHMLITLGSLFRFMVELKMHLPPDTIFCSYRTTAVSDYRGIIREENCRWSTKRVEMAAQVIVEKLKNSEFRWVPRQEIRDAARAYIGDTGLLDYVLKTLGNHIVGNYIVRRAVNPITKVLEYCLEDISNVSPVSGNHPNTRIRFQLTRMQLMRDMFYLYKHILKQPTSAVVSGMLDPIPGAVRMVLDTKHFVKDYQQGLSPKKNTVRYENMKVMCSIWVKANRNTEELNVKELPPYETMILPTHATVGELKREVERHFRAMYWGMKSFIAYSIIDVESNDWDLVCELMESGSRVIIEGGIKEMDVGEIYEGGKNDKIVDCLCGAKEDDGERMICCDICGVWKHTRCMGIPDEEEVVPPLFLCGRCENGMIALPGSEAKKLCNGLSSQISIEDPTFSNMTTPREWWRRAAAAAKDKRSLCMTRMASVHRHHHGGSGGDLQRQEVDMAVIRATSHDEQSVDYKSAERVLEWARAAPSSFLDRVMWSLAHRTARTRSWAVALKSLLLAHGLLICSDDGPLTARIGRLPFDLSDFRDRTSSGFSAFIRAYFRFLDQRSLFASHKKLLQVATSDSDADLTDLEHLQTLLDLLLQVRPYADGMEVELVLEAMDCVMIEIFEVHRSICNGIAHFLADALSQGSSKTTCNQASDARRRRGALAMRVLRRAAAQSSQLSAYLDLCRSLGVLEASELPAVQSIPEEDLADIERLLLGCAEEEESGGAEREEGGGDHSGTVITERWVAFEDEEDQGHSRLPRNRGSQLGEQSAPNPDLIELI
ncbi:PHD finger protein PERSISTENT TAPETAL CELL 1 [Canna indica]|uniref:PHD finger protein PERSISTENT TAPETAL CELL 1 n=1 Tax=Canna indica TaxID=4628 RepID=A0AAQ3KHR5_9LILI|nr:PHD finger protein PERSISTENT TAPETAL CELL 1 [Canna indica]